MPDQSSRSTAPSGVRSSCTRCRSASASPVARRNASCSSTAAASSARIDSSRNGRIGRGASGPPYGTPSSASIASPPSTAVRIQAPLGVSVNVCSKCAAQLPSSVTHGPLVVVERRVLAAERDHRLHRQRQPALELRSTAGSAVVGHVGRLVHRGADAVAGELLEDPVVAALADVGLDGVRDVADPAAEPGGGEAGPHRALGDPHQLGRPRQAPRPTATVIAASPCQPSTIAPQSIEITSPSREHPVARDAVHDLVVDRRADRGREGRVAVALERRDTAVRADVVLGDRVELAGGDAGTYGGAQHLERLTGQQAGDAHLLDLVGRLDLDAAVAEAHRQVHRGQLSETSSSAAKIRSVTSSTSPMPSTSISSPRPR